jgi:hypothetical protein
VNPPASAQYPSIRIWPIGWKDFQFQLIGTGTGYAVTVYGTFDQNTADGNATNWFQLPGAPTDATSAQWSNPMYSLDQNNGNASMLVVKAPLLAVRAVSSAAFGNTPTGDISLYYMVTS